MNNEIVEQIEALPDGCDLRTFNNLLNKYVDVRLNTDDLKALAAELEALREFVESAQMIHFKHNGKSPIIFKDTEGDTFTLLHGDSASKGHTHVWDAFKALKEKRWKMNLTNLVGSR
jgi:hypothetical protein